jgi:hypothetical protein
MIHIGTKEYYDQISNMCDDLNMILMEGVQTKKMTELGKYKKTAKIFGLKNQSDFLKIDVEIPIRNLDIDKDTFDEEYGKIKLSVKLAFLKFSFALFILSFNKNNSIKLLKKYFSYNSDDAIKLINPHNHYSYKHNKSPFEYLIKNVRDNNIENNFKGYIEENINRSYRYDVGILFGDYHMPIFYKILQNYGYKWKMVKKIEIF